jgi:peptidoglycan/xylan/chitin deacetylase (PgdA/CDA1 family)
MTLTCYTHGSRDRDVVALTFDDGPNPPITGQVLDLLAAAGAKATFFVIGKWVERWPDTLRRIDREGHTVGNHTQTHEWGTGDYDIAEPVIANVLGSPTRFARAPAFDYASCEQSELIRSGRLALVDADVNPSDWNCTDGAEIARRVLEHPSLGSGSIVDLHDGTDRFDAEARISRPAAMLAALPVILDGLRRRGLRPVGLDDFTFDAPEHAADVQRDRTRFDAQRAAQSHANPATGE